MCMLGQIASLGLKMSVFEVLRAYGDRRWICCSLDGFTLHNKGFLSFFHFSSHTLCPLFQLLGLNCYLLARVVGKYGPSYFARKNAVIVFSLHSSCNSPSITNRLKKKIFLEIPLLLTQGYSYTIEILLDHGIRVPGLKLTNKPVKTIITINR